MKYYGNNKTVCCKLLLKFIANINSKRRRKFAKRKFNALKKIRF